MTAGTYGEGSSLTTNVDRYSERMGYDANGNITSISRYGKKSSGYGLMDNLTITYSGNQLSNVSETVADYDYSGSFEYKKAKGSQYMYNRNGSLIADKSRGIVYITYDFNNNPKQIYFDNGNVTKYVYSASGEKLRVVHYTAKPNITRQFGRLPAELTVAQILQSDSTDYLLGGSLVLKNGKIDKYLFEGGYCQATATGAYTDTFAFHYYNQDHLGNNREVVDPSGNVVQVTNYYPFGAPYADDKASLNPDKQQYKYNSKELDRMHGLNTYDYGARQHDPILGRWDRIDPLCEKYYNVSPYMYCMNNPVMFIDPDGMDYWSTNDPDQIKAFMDSMKNGKRADMSNWNHTSDCDFLANLHYNDISNKYYYNNVSIENGELVCTARVFSGSLVDSRGWKKTSDRNTNLGSALGVLENVTGNLVKAAAKYTFYDNKGNLLSTFQPRIPHTNIKFDAMKARKFAKFAKTLGKVSAGVSAAMTIYEMTEGKKRLVGEGGVDLIMTGVGIWGGPIGFGASLMYFGRKMYLEETDQDFWNK